MDAQLTLEHATLEKFISRVSSIHTVTEGADEVPAERLVDALLTLEHASLEEHLRITFELLDTRGDGSIARENMVEILKVGALAAHAPADRHSHCSCHQHPTVS